MRTLILLLLTFASTTFSLSAQSGKVEYGLASFYSDDFKGRTTASGDNYDPAVLTAAHKSLPFGSIVKVTNMENNKTTMVRINDKGPFIKGYVIELSRRAAKDLAVKGDQSKVKLEVYSEGADIRKSEIEESRTSIAAPESYEDNNPFEAEEAVSAAPDVAAAPATAQPAASVATKEESKEEVGASVLTEAKASLPNKAIDPKGFKVFDLYKTSTFVPQAGGYGVQVGVFEEVHNVLKKTAQLQESWFSNIMLTREADKGKITYKVIIGPFEERASAVAYQKSAKQKGVDGYVVAVQPSKNREVYQIKAVRPAKEGFAVQVMSLTDADHVVLEMEKLKKRWFDNILVHVAKGADGKPQYKIMLGPLPSRAKAESYKASLAKNKGIKGFVVDLSTIKASH